MSEAITWKVWDLPVRIFHWSLLLAVAGAWFTHRAGVLYFRYHLWCGYAVLILVSFRILWGWLGTRHARFAHFVRGPGATLRYLGEVLLDRAAHTAGHNPLGAWMVVLLLTLLLGQALTGLFGNDEIFNTGPLVGYVGNATSVALTRIHRQLFDLILIAIGLHVLAVLAHWLFRRENLVLPLFTGRKPATQLPANEAIRGSRLWLAVSLLLGLCLALAWLVRSAPAGAALSDPF
ncbi:MAG: cytochrome b/b6 domain-containing protein [Steroidobacteraceae bacterium]